MDQVGYDTYCKLLDEVVKEMKGIEIPKEEIEVVIDINVSTYIPDEYIESKEQKIEVYQNIALARSEEDIKNIIEDISDRYGKMPNEVKNLISVAEIKEMCKNVGIVKVSQTETRVVFTFEPDIFTLDVQTLLKKYSNRIRFSSGVKPYMVYKLQNEENAIKEIKELIAS